MDRSDPQKLIVMCADTHIHPSNMRSKYEPAAEEALERRILEELANA